MEPQEDERLRRVLQGNYSTSLSLVSTLQVLIHSDKSLYRFYCALSELQTTDWQKKMKDHRPSRTSVCARENIWVSWRWSASHPPGAFYSVPSIRRADFLISALRWRRGKNKTCKGEKKKRDLTQAVNRVVPSPSEHLKRPKKSHYSLALSFSVTHTHTLSTGFG